MIARKPGCRHAIDHIMVEQHSQMQDFTLLIAPLYTAGCSFNEPNARHRGCMLNGIIHHPVVAPMHGRNRARVCL